MHQTASHNDEWRIWYGTALIVIIWGRSFALHDTNALPAYCTFGILHFSIRACPFSRVVEVGGLASHRLALC